MAGRSASGVEAVNALLGRAVGAGLTPGAVAAWGRGSSPEVVGVGRTAVGEAPAGDPRSSWYDLASLTKPLVVTTLCLLARRRGELDLDVPLQDLLEETRGRALGRVTVAELLTHTAGLPDWLPLYALTSNPREVAAVLAARPLEAHGQPPVRYSCLGFILLGIALERVGGASLDRLFVEGVVEPLGLEDELGFVPGPERRVAGGAAFASVERELTAALGEDPEKVPPAAPGRPDDGNARFLGGVAGNAGLFGSAVGVYRLTREYLPGGGELLRPDEAVLATRPGVADAGGVRGLGWQLAASPGCSAGPSLSGAAFGHVGFTGTSVWADPAGTPTLVLLANRHHPGHRGVDFHPLRRRFHAVALGPQR